jgi:NADH:ubiquinone oxidoreductase subunit
MLSWLGKLFVWWRDATPGTLVTTWYSGQKVGDDNFGNRYYETKDGKRRWVIYAGTVEASRVPPEWHGWLHYTTDVLPVAGGPPRMAWQKDHLPNLTGTGDAYRPAGHTLVVGDKPKPPYEAWRPS